MFLITVYNYTIMNKIQFGQWAADHCDDKVSLEDLKVFTLILLITRITEVIMWLYGQVYRENMKSDGDAIITRAWMHWGMWPCTLKYAFFIKESEPPWLYLWQNPQTAFKSNMDRLYHIHSRIKFFFSQTKSCYSFPRFQPRGQCNDAANLYISVGSGGRSSRRGKSQTGRWVDAGTMKERLWRWRSLSEDVHVVKTSVFSVHQEEEYI